MIEWAWPFAAVLLLLPLLLWFNKRSEKDNLSTLPAQSVLIQTQHSAHGNQQSRPQLPWVLLIAFALIVIALMRPQWVGEPVEQNISGRDIMLAVDLSGSMEEQDFKIKNKRVNRLQATKVVASEFISRRQGDRIGLILFGENAYLQTPLTFDRKTVNQFLLESQIGLAGERTAIGDAITLGVKRLKDTEKDSRVLILLTDGANTAGRITPLKAAEIAKRTGLKIYTIGIGADEMIRRDFFFQRKVNPSRDLDEDTLTEIAKQTGGQYFRARDTEELNQIYRIIDQLEPIDVEVKSYRPTEEWFFYPLGLALIWLMLFWSLSTWREVQHA